MRGKPTVQLSNQTTVLHAPAGEHSEKPQAFYEMVEALCPAPRYCELFQRKARPQWDGHDEVMISEVVTAEAASAKPDVGDVLDIPDFVDRRHAGSAPPAGATQ